MIVSLYDIVGMNAIGFEVCEVLLSKVCGSGNFSLFFSHPTSPRESADTLSNVDLEAFYLLFGLTVV